MFDMVGISEGVDVDLKSTDWLAIIVRSGWERSRRKRVLRRRVRLMGMA
jgi:hypothetical protein